MTGYILFYIVYFQKYFGCNRTIVKGRTIFRRSEASPLTVLGIYCMQMELLSGGRDSVVIIASRCEFQGPGFENPVGVRSS